MHKRITRTPRTPVPPWEGQRFGRDWIFLILHDSALWLLSTAVLQLCHPGEFYPAPTNPGFESINLSSEIPAAEVFIGIFRSAWDRLPRSLINQVTAYKSFDSKRRDFICQFHTRFLVIMPKEPEKKSRPISCLARHSGEIISPSTKQVLSFFEKRISTAIRTTWHLEFPVFTLVTISDFSYPSIGTIFHNLDLQPSTNLVGKPSAAVNCFVLRVEAVFDEALLHWNSLLDVVDSSLDVGLASILSHEKRLSIMYDDTELSLSEFYFVVTEVLRFASDWVKESLKDLGALLWEIELEEQFIMISRSSRSESEESCYADDPSADPPCSNAHFEIVELTVTEKCNTLFARIDEKQKKIERLRNTLFTSTAVKEASKSKQINHCILVFKVITIIYLPLSFVCTLFALDAFDWNNPGQKAFFTITAVTVEIATNAFSGYLIWAVRRPLHLAWWRELLSVNTLRRIFQRQLQEEEEVEMEELSHIT
ncbi:hypothetical protein QBC38DRAFT_56882 [Podospora fimiseda]|uniref:Uncharacterized protein n=1 Tax=Podospora fimiseda TaxID=252190 RepID=A0AAN7GZN6_9PEZI|nr:hypothetical protein QBC38DRAFT_56882 [Podospora fimiseda]